MSSPAKLTERTWVPTEKDEDSKLADPVVSKLSVPRVVAPSLRTTEPEGVTVLEGVTLTDTLRGVPIPVDALEEVTATLTNHFCIDSTRFEDELGRVFVSPL